MDFSAQKYLDPSRTMSVFVESIGVSVLKELSVIVAVWK